MFPHFHPSKCVKHLAHRATLFLINNNVNYMYICTAGKFDPHKYTNADMAKVHMITYEVLIEDEESQVMGFTHVGDMCQASAAHATVWSPTEFTTLVRWGEVT